MISLIVKVIACAAVLNLVPKQLMLCWLAWRTAPGSEDLSAARRYFSRYTFLIHFFFSLIVKFDPMMSGTRFAAVQQHPAVRLFIIGCISATVMQQDLKISAYAAPCLLPLLLILAYFNEDIMFMVFMLMLNGSYQFTVATEQAGGKLLCATLIVFPVLLTILALKDIFDNVCVATPIFMWLASMTVPTLFTSVYLRDGILWSFGNLITMSFFITSLSLLALMGCSDESRVLWVFGVVVSFSIQLGLCYVRNPEEQKKNLLET